VKGFESDGFLCFYDLAGKLIATLPVTSGKANIRLLPHGFLVWVLEDKSLNEIARGKLTW
jgi:hypothetical protein